MSVEIGVIAPSHTLEVSDEMRKFGIRSDWELQRFNAVREIVGDTVAMREIHRNVEAYEREFLQDEPVGKAHTYFHINHELYSESVDHPLFNIKQQIDKRERDGRTHAGFARFEEIVTRSNEPEEIAIWYSPAGIAGNEAPFDNIYFDAGRLYLAYTGATGESVHLDIKIDENRFPIVQFLDELSYYTQEHVRPPQQSYEEATYHYLDNPLKTELKVQEFFHFVTQFVEYYNYQEDSVYTSQRESAFAREHTMSQIFEEAQAELLSFSKKDPAFISLKQSKAFTQQEIFEFYMDRIRPYVVANGGSYTLYGCSTTSTIGTADITGGKAAAFFDMVSPGSLFTPYSSVNRILGTELFSVPKQQWKFDKKGDCQKCHKNDEKVGLLGPCLVCRKCQKNYDEQEYVAKVRQMLSVASV